MRYLFGIASKHLYGCRTFRLFSSRLFSFCKSCRYKLKGFTAQSHGDIVFYERIVFMVNINGYGQYNNYTKAASHSGRTDDKAKNSDKTDFSAGLRDKMTVSSSSTQKLSSTAQSYLERLKNKYGNMDFIIADYDTDEEADSLLAGGKGEYNVLITPDLLEKMAADESVAAQYEGVIESSVSDIKTARSELGEDADMVESFGITLNSDGTVSITAKLIEGLTASDGSRTVKSGTVAELMERLNETKQAQAEKLAQIRKENAEKAEKAKKKEEEKSDKEKTFSAKA